MTLWDQLMATTRQMLREPREAARVMMAIDLSRETVMMAFLAVMAVSIIATEPLLAVASSMLPGDAASPFMRAIGSTLGGLAVVWVIWKAGAFLGGAGQFDHILLGFVVLEAVFVIGIVGLLVLTAVMPPLAGLAGLGFVMFWIWMFSNVVAEMHGFPSAWKAFGVVALSWVIVNYASMLILNLLAGVAGGPSNV